MKRILFCILLLGAFLSDAGARRYPFIRPDKSVLQYPAGSSPDYSLFLRKLDTLLTTGSGDVRVLQIGGSHVQGGTLSDHLRRRFLSLRYGIDGGRGLVFPFSAAGTNTPSSYMSSWQGSWESANCLKPNGMDLGLTGMAAQARDTSARVIIDLVLKEKKILQHRYTFNKVDVLGEGTLEPLLILNGKDTVKGVHGPRMSHFDLPYYADWLQLSFRGKGTYTLRGLYLDRPASGFTLSEAGVNGASTHSWLQCSLLEEDLRRVQPDLVLLSVGINDIQGGNFDEVRFKANYRALIQQIRKVNPHCALLFTGINDSWRRGAGINEHTAEAEKAFRDLAAEYKAVFWDWYEVMGGYGSMARWEAAGLAQPDKIHFTPLGYREVADYLFDAMAQDYYSRR